MPSDNSESVSRSLSVSPRVIVPSVTVIGLLVLITIAGAVTIFVRAYKKKKRRQSRVSKSDVEAGLPGEDPPRRFWGRRRHGNETAKDPHEPSTAGGVDDIMQPERAHINRGSRRFSRDAIEIVEQGFRFGRSNSHVQNPKAVVVGRGYTLRHTDEITRKEPQVAETSINNIPTPPPLIGKIERLTGNPLSNDLYSGWISGATSVQSRGGSTATNNDARRKSHPPPPLSTQANFLSPPDPKPTLKVATKFSPVSAVTDSSRDFSPNYNEILGIAHALSPPPAPPPHSALGLKYPNVTALARTSVEETNKSKRSSKRLSYTYEGTSRTEHIASQYNPTKQHRLSFNRASRTGSSGHTLVTHFSSAFGNLTVSGCDNGNARSAGSQVTFSKFEAGPASFKVPPHRRSWSGRSVLELDVPTTIKSPPPPPPPPHRRSFSPPLRKDPARAQKLDPLPQVRVSAFGPRRSTQPPLPRIPSGGRDSFGAELPAGGLSRSGSISKNSVASMPSSISSFNTVTPWNPAVGGLSPTPAPRSLLLNLPLPPPPPPPNSVAGDDLSRKGSRKSTADDASTLFSETSDGNLTEKELERDWNRIRERARRVSEERKSRRREAEELERRRLDGAEGEGSGTRGGYRLI
ncbi:hypothetical protein RUND412_011358 [Rhizina undulata]